MILTVSTLYNRSSDTIGDVGLRIDKGSQCGTLHSGICIHNDKHCERIFLYYKCLVLFEWKSYDRWI